MGGRERGRDHWAELERSRKRWDFWSSYWGFINRDTGGVRRETIDVLDLGPGDTVLDLGCGPGVNVGMLEEAVGPEGRILAVDLSPKMLDRARERVDANGWENVALVRSRMREPSRYRTRLRSDDRDDDERPFRAN